MQRSDSAGVELVTYEGEDMVLPWEFQRLFALGGDDSGPGSFYRVTMHSVGSDAAGNIYVLDYDAHRVVKFTPDGEFEAAMGGEGGGPSEFRNPAALWVTPDGIVSVYDFGKGAVVRFDAEGGVLPQVPVARPPAADSRFFAVSTAGLVMTTYNWTGGSQIMGYDLVSVADSDSTVLASVSHMGGEMVVYEECGGGLNLAPIFAPQITWDLYSSTVGVNSSAEYAIAVFEGGSLVRKIYRPLVPVTASSDLAMAELGEGMRVNFGRGPCLITAEKLVDGRGFAELVPTIAGIKLTPDGQLWAQRKVAGEEAGPIDIYDRDAAYVGTLPDGTPFPVLFLTESRIGVVERDELDVDRLVILQIER